MIHVFYHNSHIYGTVVSIRAIQEGVYLRQGMRTDVQINVCCKQLIKSCGFYSSSLEYH